MKKLNLRQFLSKTGIFSSQKHVIEAIRNNEIKIDEEFIVNPLYQFNHKKRKVFWNGRLIEMVDDKVYILLNKPIGYLSTRLTPLDKKLKKRSMFELLENAKFDEKTKQTLFCVGRLDEDSSGLIIITNDGKLGIKIARPESNVEKTYSILLEKPITSDTVKKAEEGVLIDLEVNKKITKYKTKKAKILQVNSTMLEIAVTEGKKREIRRIFEALGNKVLELEKISIGNLKLKDLGLRHGEYRIVSKGKIISIF